MNAHPRLQVAACVTRYQSCTVDPRPGRAVHCPDLNACLVNEGRPDPVDCHAVHFGYAIPISVMPLDEEPSLAELVLDSDTDLSPRTVAYLLDHHPQLRSDNANERVMMASTAPEEDIAAIAKQISDHAEAIYQTWKSRGLAPTEILSVHNASTAADQFGSALTPQPQMSNSKGHSVVDINLDTNNLERLVSDFVVEDKARLAARFGKISPKPVPSSIQYARQKFEKPSLPDTSLSHSSVTIGKTQFETNHKTQPSKIPTAQFPRSSSPKLQPSIQRGPHLETIETILPADITVQKVHPVRKIPNITENNPTSGLSTWPLKNKNVSSINEKRVGVQINVENESKRKSMQEDSSSNKFSSVPLNNKNTAEYLDEVAREEERLINALKTGIIIAEDPTVSKSPSPTKKKSDMLLKKNGEKDVQKENAKTQRSPGPVGLSRNTTPTTQGNVNVRTTTVENKTQQSVIKTINKNSVSNMSAVDYAKERYRVIAQQRLEENKRLDQKTINPPEKTSQQVIPVSRNRFEVAPRTVANETWGRQDEDSGLKRATPARLRHPPLETVPHPELTSHQRHLRVANGSNPVRPFLTRGSVAERVLIFEKCPTEILLDKRRSVPSINTWRSGHEVHTKAQTYSRNKENERPPNTTLQRHVKANRNVHIPRFYFPHGKPVAEQQQETILKRFTTVFQQFTNKQVPRDKFNLVVKACDFPLYWKVPLLIATGGEKLGFVELSTYLDFWKKMTVKCHDQASRFIYVLTKGQRDTLSPEDFIPLIQDVVDSHPGLTFLKEATEFHSRYVHTVIARIFYCVNRSWSGRISLPELRRSNLLQIVQLLEEEEDINQVTAYFSYEHFYVIYCKFWELDQDHDLYIDRHDLQRHSDHALSSRMIERIFSGAVTRGPKQNPDKMSYTEFVWFLLSEEDKAHPTAIEYWFRCMDLDGDGYLSMYELEYFYEEQLQRMESIGIETLPFEDCLCQMLDMIHPATPGKISLSDLKKCKMTPIFFDTFFNLEKYLDHEQRDPFASQRDHDSDGQELSDWDRYAAEEYELLVAEEGGNDHQDDMMYEDDIDGEDFLSPNLDVIVSEDTRRMNGHWKKPSFAVTDFDAEEEEEDDDDDYAGDSDEGSV